MRRVLLISLSLVLALVGWSAVCAEDGFYVIPSTKRNYAPVPKTGQTVSDGTRDDGALQKGVAWPTPRFTDNKNNTVTDNLTKLIWTKNANYWGQNTQEQALSYANSLQDIAPIIYKAGVHDGSKAGDWRLPNVRELQSLLDYGHQIPNIHLPSGHPFTGVRNIGAESMYWSSTLYGGSMEQAWQVNFIYPGVPSTNLRTGLAYVWCVRGGP
jgi:hypothetical protein